VAHFYLVGCVKSKRPTPARAADLYTSALFRKSRRLAELRSDRWYILSAKHGLVAPDVTMAPYDDTLKCMAAATRRTWSQKVLCQLLECLSPGDEVTVLAGERYREHLVPALQRAGHRVHVPMRGLSIGRQLQWLDERLNCDDVDVALLHESEDEPDIELLD